MSPYREVEHTADWALKIRADDMAGLLHHAAKGMLQLMGAQSQAPPEGKVPIEIEAIDREILLVEWLQELLYLMESKGVGIGEMTINVENETHLHALVEIIPGAILSKEIKAVTYHGLEIATTETGLETTIVFDV